ncbi:DUF6585 family protein [Nocardia sp. alder85J]|uniref:DUF6585 family protein n=1 Tax=Nocardia sp. alder85J TaxID=2862949 RepID=UPI001CD25E7D|nr:DUF6585 family protein [Nocardia sp. alder85J]MCX4093151.1 hypothetical protein [Nocardia sp. alder85J]
MASYEQLGEHRQTFLRAPASGDSIVRGCGLVTAGLVAVSGLCIVAGAPAAAVVVVLLALVPGIFAAVRSRHNRRSRGARLDLFDRGLTVYHSGETIVGFHWDTVEVRQQSIPLHQSAAAATDYAFVLTGPSGNRAEFDESEFAGAREWGPIVQSAVTAAQLPGIVAAIDGEQTVHFGALAVSLLELVHDGARYPWERIQTIDPRGGIVRIKVDGNWISLGPVGAIPNFYIFNEVIERLRVAAVEYPDPYGPRRPAGGGAPAATAVVAGAATPDVVDSDVTGDSADTVPDAGAGVVAADSTAGVAAGDTEGVATAAESAAVGGEAAEVADADDSESGDDDPATAGQREIVVTSGSGVQG